VHFLIPPAEEYVTGVVTALDLLLVHMVAISIAAVVGVV
jgi:hypothetical protein